jgi:large subunit ribosomal protein L5
MSESEKIPQTEEKEAKPKTVKPPKGEAKAEAPTKAAKPASLSKDEAKPGAVAKPPKTGEVKTAKPAKGESPAKAAGPKAEAPKAEIPKTIRLKEKYLKEVAPKLMAEFGFKNTMQVPKLTKISVNVGLGEAQTNNKALESAERDMAAITGQHPVVTRAKKSISAFKIRAGMPVGMRVTLRGRRMYEFMDKFVNAVLPRFRDFQGVPRTGFDGRGNYTLGLKDQTPFPEIEYDKIDKVRGLEISIVTSAGNDPAGRRLLELLGMPFRQD